MSSPDALATVTATLQHLLSDLTTSDTAVTTVTTKPPSAARTNNTGDQINIFLYSIYYNTAFSNTPMPGETRRGEQAHPPLPLVLKYLITAYGAGDEDILGQQLMGQAMSRLHDHPLLGPTEIVGIDPDSNLQEQIERIRITPDTLSLDDMSKLWASFQSAEYRLSTGYEVSVILIDSTRPSRTPLPVLKRGAEDHGPEVVLAPLPSLSGLSFPNQKPAAELGDLVTLIGKQLSSDDTIIRFHHPQLVDPIELSPKINNDNTEMTVQLPGLADDPQLEPKWAEWPAGFYTVSVVTQRTNSLDADFEDEQVWSSNSVAMPLSPNITSISVTSISPLGALTGNVVLTIECLPRIRGDQSVALLFSDRAIEPDPIDPDPIDPPLLPTDPTTLKFTLVNAEAGVYLLRLRVDGVDSIPVVFSGDSPEFDPDQHVTIT